MPLGGRQMTERSDPACASFGVPKAGFANWDVFVLPTKPKEWRELR
jgi:hypothetical protein